MSGQQKLACRELMRRGDISWLCHPEQARLLEWLDERRREIAVVVTSRQWGKTMALLMYAMSHCIANPRHTVLLLAPHLQQLTTILMPRLNQIFMFAPEDIIPHRRENVWSFRNGSVLRLDGIGINKGVRIRGDAVHLCVLDECRDVPDLEEVVHAHLTPMFTTTNGRLVLISTPPDSPAHSFTSVFVRNALVSGDLFSATYQRNPLLTTERLRYLVNTQFAPEGLDHPLFQREYNANWALSDPEKRVVREWQEDKNDEFFATYQDPTYPVRPYLAMDYAHADPCALIGGWFDPRQGCLVVVDELFERHLNTQDVGEQVQAMEARLRSRIPHGCPPTIRVMDVDPGMMSDLYTLFGLRFEPANKVNTQLAMHNKLRTAIAEGRVKIHPDCVQLRFQLLTGVFNPRQNDYLRTEKTGHLDLIDALKYCCLNLRWQELLETEAPPQTGPGQVWIGPRRESPFSQTGAAFAGGVTRRPV